MMTDPFPARGEFRFVVSVIYSVTMYVFLVERAALDQPTRRPAAGGVDAMSDPTHTTVFGQKL